jgi:SAM-dependent methyltransferase
MTFDEQRSQWDTKYEHGLPSLEKPDPFFLSAFDQFVADLFPNGGTALDLGGGIGRHALWLAKRNWQVTLVDISEVAIRKLDQKARQFDLTLDLFALDAREYRFKTRLFRPDRDVLSLRPRHLSECALSTETWGPSDLQEQSELEVLRRIRSAQHQAISEERNPGDAPGSAGDAPSGAACTQPWRGGVCREKPAVR